MLTVIDSHEKRWYVQRVKICGSRGKQDCARSILTVLKDRPVSFDLPTDWRVEVVRIGCVVISKVKGSVVESVDRSKKI